MSDEEYRKIFQKKLKYYMTLNNKTQADLINDLGFSSSTISNWCTGLKLPRMGKIQLLADYFGINKSDLIEDKTITNDVVTIKSRTLEKQLLSSFNKLNDDNKKKAITYTENLLKIEEMENEHLLVKAAHNDFAEDEKEQKLMQEDIDEL